MIQILNNKILKMSDDCKIDIVYCICGQNRTGKAIYVNLFDLYCNCKTLMYCDGILKIILCCVFNYSIFSLSWGVARTPGPSTTFTEESRGFSPILIKVI